MRILCNSIEDVAQIVNSIKSTENIDVYKENLRKAKEMLLPQNVAVRLKEIIENAN